MTELEAIIRREAEIRTAYWLNRYPGSDVRGVEVEQWDETLIDAGLSDGYVGDPEASGSAFEPEIPAEFET